MSRDRDRDRSRDRDRDRRSLDRDRRDYRSPEFRRNRNSRDRDVRDRDRGEPRGYKDPIDEARALISSNEPELLKKRVFIGNLATDRLSKSELHDMFELYGRVRAVAIYKGYGFVQFDREEDARKSVAQEHGGMIKGQRVDVKMAAEGKKQKEFGNYPRPGNFRDRSPMRDHPPYRDSYGPPPPHYSGRDPYDDPYRRGPPPPPPPGRDPYYDPYVRDPYREPYLPPPPPAAAPPPPAAYPPPANGPPERPAFDCEILISGRSLRDYAEGIEQRLKSASGMLCYINTLPEDVPVARAIEEVGRRGILYAISINPQNEVHRSITVTILHGAPQEHRNMPLDDALTLIQRNFEEYIKNLKSHSSPANPEEILWPDQKASYLLNLLADNRFLTIAELDTVLLYLNERRERLLQKQRAAISGKEPEEDAMARKQQELQAKILSVLGDNAVTSVPTAATLNTAVSMVQSFPSQVVSQVQSPPQSTGNNFTPTSIMENPNVQQALDKLISSGPNLLRSINASQQMASGSHLSMMNSQGYQYTGY